MLTAMLMLQVVTTPVGSVAPIRASSACVGDACRPDATERYRFRALDPVAERVEAKREVLTQRWRECGIMGAPVCPRQGRKVWSMTLP